MDKRKPTLGELNKTRQGCSLSLGNQEQSPNIQMVKALFLMKLGYAEGTSEGMLCNDNDAANS